MAVGIDFSTIYARCYDRLGLGHGGDVTVRDKVLVGKSLIHGVFVFIYARKQCKAVV